jgi:hypothetical protein
VLVLPDELRGTDEGLRLEKTLTSGVENAIAWVPAQYIGVISWLKPAPLPELSYKALADAKPRILENIGVSEYQTLSVPTGPERTKFEVNQIAQQGNTRQASEIQMYLDFVQDVAWCVLTLFQQFIDPEKERAYRTVDPTGHPRYGMASVFQLRNGKPKDGEVEDFSSLLEPGLQFAITVDPTKVNQPDIYQDRQNMVELLGVLDKYADMPDPLRPTDPTATLINRRAMLESLISSFDLPNQEEIIRNPPSEDEKQDIVAQLQQKLAQTMQVIQKMGQQMQGMQPGAAPAPGQQPVPQPMPGQGVPAPQEIPGGLPQ